jgi:sodium-dependent phosphate cotransporter
MFLTGMVVTTMTLSVSVSLSILVPLSIRGYVRRENIIPYIMGANITTFVDTLVASLLINNPYAFTIVLTQTLCIALFSIFILALLYRHYQRMMEWLVERISRRDRTLLFFMGAVLALPWVLLQF